MSRISVFSNRRLCKVAYLKVAHEVAEHAKKFGEQSGYWNYLLNTVKLSLQDSDGGTSKR